MYGLRRFAPIALLAALRASVPAVAFADPPRPSGATNAATNQSQDLIARGQALFDDQRYQESIQTLSGALVRPNNTKDEKLEIYRLLALDYITLSRTEVRRGPSAGSSRSTRRTSSRSASLRAFAISLRRRSRSGKPRGALAW